MSTSPNPHHADKALFDAPSSVSMRLARPDDASYIYSLRINPAFNRHLSPPPPSVEAQRAFLEGYLARETAGTEFYFVIVKKETGHPCGVVRLYDLQADSFCWGSWILDHTKPRLAAVESAMFVYDFAFGLLGYSSCHFDVRRDNVGVISFHKRFGAVETAEDEQNFYFRLDADALRAKLPALVALTGYSPVRFTA